jgi:hypothetical protein
MSDNRVIIKAALEYINRGEVVIPLNGKAPTDEGWPDQRLTVEDVPVHFRNATGIGLLNGIEPSNFIDLDLDHPLAPAFAKHHGVSSGGLGPGE